MKVTFFIDRPVFSAVISIVIVIVGIIAVSYTHLDVYKRQRQRFAEYFSRTRNIFAIIFANLYD